MTIIISKIGLYGLLACESMLRMFNGNEEKNDLKAARRTRHFFAQAYKKCTKKVAKSFENKSGHVPRGELVFS